MFLFDDALKLLKASTDGKRFQILINDAKTAVKAAEQMFKPGENQEKYEYAYNRLKDQHPQITDREAEALIEASVYELKPQKAPKKPGKYFNEFAQSAQEYIEKYKSKRFNAANAGLCITYEYTYQLYRQEDKNPDLPPFLYTQERRNNILQRAYESEITDNAYFAEGNQKLIEWLPTAFDAATAAREAANMAITTATAKLDYTIFIAEQLKKKGLSYTELCIEKPEGTEALREASLHGALEANSFRQTRDFIENSLCYLHAFNVFIRKISDAINLPEFYAFAVDRIKVKRSLEALNNKIEQYRTTTNLNRYDLCTYTSESEKIITPIDVVPKPLPEENKKDAVSAIHLALYNRMTWGTALSEMTKGYWQRVIL